MNGNSAAEQSERASRRSVVLVTGMSGSGKSTVLAELNRRGHRVIDTGDPGWIVETQIAGGGEPVWDLEQIKALIDGDRTGWLFIAGCVANQGAVYDRVDAVVLLSAPVDVILNRVAIRSDPWRRAWRRSPTTWPRSSRCCARADREIVTTAPVPEVVAELEHVALGAGHRDPLRSRRPHRT